MMMMMSASSFSLLISVAMVVVMVAAGGKEELSAEGVDVVQLSTMDESPMKGTRNKRSDDPNPLENQMAQLAQEVTLLQAKLQSLSNKIDDVSHMPGSTFVRWGRSKCPTHSELVYSGRAGGSYRETVGGSPNRLCLPLTPQFDGGATPPYYGRLYGAKYLQIPNHHDLLVPCSLCHVPHSSTVMIPASLTCPQSWQMQYTGHLASEDHNHASIAEYVCLDGAPENVVGSSAIHEAGSYFYYTVTVCGTLPCPPYVANKVVTCVVCSK